MVPCSVCSLVLDVSAFRPLDYPWHHQRASSPDTQIHRYLSRTPAHSNPMPRSPICPLATFQVGRVQCRNGQTCRARVSKTNVFLARHCRPSGTTKRIESVPRTRRGTFSQHPCCQTSHSLHDRLGHGISENSLPPARPPHDRISLCSPEYPFHHQTPQILACSDIAWLVQILLLRTLHEY